MYIMHVCLTYMHNIGAHCLCYKLQVIFWPDNIVSLFERFGVKKKFDFLSEDSDSYDFFMTEAILEVYFILCQIKEKRSKEIHLCSQAGFAPRVIMMEYNANFEVDEARSILPPGKGYSIYQ